MNFARILLSSVTILFSFPWLLCAAPKTENVILITIDGLRWQEVFRGAEQALINRENGGVTDTNRLNTAFWRDTPEDRRSTLMPFFWNQMAKHGQLYGNTNKGSIAMLTNGRKFTYPGFNEILTGFADDRIISNDQRNNPNQTVLEWLFHKPGFTNRIAAFVNWTTHPYILNSQRSGIPAWSGYETNLPVMAGSAMDLIQQIHRDTTPLWRDMNFDSFYLHMALEYMKEKKPRILWIAFSEPDEWAHEGRYDYYLQATHKIDSYVQKLWEFAQSHARYRDKTTLILTCDHGRGEGPSAWKNHGAAIEGAEYIWIGAMGAGIAPLGERTNAAPVYQKQIAATLAELLGEDYHSAVPKAGNSITDIIAQAHAPKSK